MSELSYRCATAHQTSDMLRKAIGILNDQLNERLYRTCRDSVIKRFKHSVDTLLTFLIVYLQEQQSIVFKVSSPREVFRTALEAQLISAEEYETLLECIADRTMTSRAYKEVVAEKLVERIALHSGLIQTIIARVKV